MIGQILPRLRLKISPIRTVAEEFETARKRFKKLKRLGKGAFGEAFSARLNGSSVIVKVSTGTPGLLSVAAAIRAMVHEINVLGMLQKFPFVPRLIEVGKNYFVQEDVQGIAMLDLLDRKGLEAREIIAAVVALGVMASMIHREGVAHGDLEARNVLFTPNGIVMIDFGTAIIKGHPVPEVLAVGAGTFKQAMEKDILTLLSTLSLALASETVPENVQIIVASAIEDFRKDVVARRITPESGVELSRDLLFALAQLGAQAKRGGRIRREKVKVLAV